MTFYGQNPRRDYRRVSSQDGTPNLGVPARLLGLRRKYLFLLRLHKRMKHDRKCQTREYREKMSHEARMKK